MLSKNYKLIKNSDFQQVYSGRKTVNSQNFRFCFDFQTNHFQLGVVTSKKIGKATVRNLVRRRISEIFQKEANQYLEKNVRLIVVTKPGIAQLSYQELTDEMKQALSKIHFPAQDFLFTKISNLEGLLNSDHRDLVIVADFDRTLTKAYHKGIFRPSTISLFRDENILGPEFCQKEIAAAKKYLPIEKDPNYPAAEKKAAMLDWWEEGFKAMIEANLKKSHFQKLLELDAVGLRDQVPEFLKLLFEKNIPLVILSGSGIGESIPMFLERNHCLYPNIHFVINTFTWEENSEDPRALSYNKPFIYSLNKNQVGIEKYPFYPEIADKKNLILMGDSYDDLLMAENFEYENILRVGILSKHTEAHLADYQKVFDLLILDDGSVKPVCEIVEKLR